MNVTVRIQELMSVRGWTEYHLAKEAGLPLSTLANIFHRGTTPSIPTLETIYGAFAFLFANSFLRVILFRSLSSNNLC